MDKYNDLRNQTIAKYEQITKPVNEMSKPEYKPGTPMNQAEYAKKYYIPAGMSLQQ